MGLQGYKLACYVIYLTTAPNLPRLSDFMRKLRKNGESAWAWNELAVSHFVAKHRKLCGASQEQHRKPPTEELAVGPSFQSRTTM
jgi:hypothetical protein